MTKKHHKKEKVMQSLQHVPSLRETASRMLSEGKISSEKKEYIDSNIEEWVASSKYVLLNLGVHIGMGFVRFTALPFPLPIGSTLRVLWVIGCRMYCNIKWDMHKKRVHSLLVLAFSAIPFLGYFAYTIPLKKKSEYLAYLYAEHVSYMLYDKTVEAKLKKAPRMIKKLAYALMVPKELREI